MSVVLRCPTCGTTQSHSGECEACSDDRVRYFCSNHTPARWLEGPVCAECGAKFGEAPRRPPPPRTIEAPPPRRKRQMETRRPRRREDDEDDEDDDEEARRWPPEVERPPALPPLAEILARLLAGRRTRTREWESTPELRLPTFPLRGCLVRLLWLLLLFLALAVTLGFSFVASVLQVMDLPVG